MDNQLHPTLYNGYYYLSIPGLSQSMLVKEVPEQNGHKFTDDIFKCISEDEMFSIEISLSFVSKIYIHNKITLVRVMAWCYSTTNRNDFAIYHTIPYHTIPYHTIPYHNVIFTWKEISLNSTGTNLLPNLLYTYLILEIYFAEIHWD